jgi:hypothetical protein
MRHCFSFCYATARYVSLGNFNGMNAYKLVSVDPDPPEADPDRHLLLRNLPNKPVVYSHSIANIKN